MRKIIKTLGVIALVAVIGFSMTACPPDGEDEAEPFFVDLSTLTLATVNPDNDHVASTGVKGVRNKSAFTKQWDDLMLLFPEFPGVDFSQYKRVTIRCKYFDESGNEITQSNSKVMVSLIYDINRDIRGPGRDIAPNIPLKEFNLGGVDGDISREGGAAVTLTKAPGAILFQNSVEDVKYIEATEIVFHNRPASPRPAPEDYAVADRWYNWTSESTATVDHFSVGTYNGKDDVCKVTIGGTAMPNDATAGWNAWRTTIGYGYTAKSNTKYTYAIEAWVDTDDVNRILHFTYYEDNTEEKYLGEDIEMTDEPETFIFTGEIIPKGGSHALNFQCANQTGTFYLKVLSITETP